MAKKKVALSPSITSKGAALPIPSGVTIGGMPVMTVGNPAVHVQLGPDVVIEAVPGVTINGKPICTVGAKTALGQSVKGPDSGVFIDGATQQTLLSNPKLTKLDQSAIAPAPAGPIAQLKAAVLHPTPATAEVLEEVPEISIQSTYAYDQLKGFATELAEATFCMVLEAVFGKKISLHAYALLYRALNEGTLAPPEIVVVTHGVVSHAAFHKPTQQIVVGAAFMQTLAETTGEAQQEQLALLYGALLEEFGHYIDWHLRNTYTQTGGDNPLDEGAVYGYKMVSFDFFKETGIDFGTAVVEGVTVPLHLDLTAVHQEVQRLMNIYKQEIETDHQDATYEYFGAGLGNPDHGYFGHYGIEKVLLKDEKKLKNERVSKKKVKNLNLIELNSILRI